tara:strand:- start:317 stop:976 length:660 start_codon:yes stop_codon:yes gene_type:complete
MKKINWPDHLTNLLVVILGITIAFYLESWKDINKSQKLEQQYLKSLAVDLKNDRSYLDTLLIINKSIEHSLDVLTGATIGKPYHEDSLVTHLLSTQFIPPFKPQKVTYESLKATGSLEVISDFELRNIIVELYEQYYRGSQEFDQAVSDHTQNYIQPYFIKNLTYISPGKIKTGFLKENEVRNMFFAEKNIFQLRSNFYLTLDKKLDEVMDQVNEAIND